MKRLFSVIFIILIFLTSASTFANTLTVSNDSISMELTVKDAYYTDYHSDNQPDDVIIEYNLTIHLDKTLHNDYKYILRTNLLLPSGLNFSYDFKLYVPPQENNSIIFKEFDIVFPDHALESGWYEITTGLELYQWGHVYAEMTGIFDPPSSGTEDTPPPAFIV